MSVIYEALRNLQRREPGPGVGMLARTLRKLTAARPTTGQPPTQPAHPAQAVAPARPASGRPGTRPGAGKGDGPAGGWRRFAGMCRVSADRLGMVLVPILLVMGIAWYAVPLFSKEGYAEFLELIARGEYDQVLEMVSRGREVDLLEVAARGQEVALLEVVAKLDSPAAVPPVLPLLVEEARPDRLEVVQPEPLEVTRAEAPLEVTQAEAPLEVTRAEPGAPDDVNPREMTAAVSAPDAFVGPMPREAGQAAVTAKTEPKADSKAEPEAVQVAAALAAAAAGKETAPADAAVAPETAQARPEAREEAPAAEKAPEKASEIPRLVADLSAAIMERDMDAVNRLFKKLEAAKAPEDPYIANMYAYLYITQGKHAEAEKLLKRLLSNNANDMEAGMNLAVVEMRTGRMAAAKQRLQTLVRLYPDEARLQSFVNSLR